MDKVRRVSESGAGSSGAYFTTGEVYA